MPTVSPTRIILIHAGKYEYADVELTQPLHLVGPNNVGKTTLVNTLQFLYIDSQRYMNFADKSMRETLRYYFPDRYSYVLFECLTPEGYQVVGVRGIGPTNQYHYERFAYQGTFSRDDYFDGDQYREYDDVNARLATRNYTLLEPLHLRAALTGGRRNKGVNLHLLPLKNKGDYERFRTVFSNLLRLAHLKQNQLKELLCEVFSSDFRQTEIRLDESFSENLNRIRRLTRELRDLEQLAPTITDVLKNADQRDAVRNRLPALWKALHQAFHGAQERDQERISRLETRREAQKKEMEQVEAKRRKLASEKEKVDSQRGELKAWLARYEKQSKGFCNFSPQLAREAKSQLEDKLAVLDRRLAGTEDADTKHLRRRINRLSAEQAKLERRLSGINSSLATHLARHLNEDELETLFSLLHPDVAGASTDDGELVLEDSQQLLHQARWLLSCVRQSTLHAEWGQLQLEVSSPTGMDEYLSADYIEEEIKHSRNELTSVRERLEAAQNAAELREKAHNLRRRRDEQALELKRYEEFADEKEQAKDYRQKREELIIRSQCLTEQIEDGLQRRESARDALRTITDEIDQLKKRSTERTELRRRLPSISDDWESSSEPEATIDTEADFKTLAQRYEQSFERYSKLHLSVERSLHHIEERSYGHFQGPERKMLKRLRQELDGLESKRDAVQRAWQGLVSGLTRSFSDLLKDLDHLRSRISGLNRVLANASVSDLSRLRLVLREKQDPTRQLRELVESEQEPLFSSPAQRDDALDYMGKLLAQHPFIHLRDLFNLQFEVSRADGSSQTYTDLDKIESNGTSITIKVLTNLVLLAGLFHPDKELTLPFFLDEASSLDQDNLRAIVEQAQNFGFVPVLASPDPAEAAELLYFPEEKSGRVYIDPERHLVRLQRIYNSDTQPPTHESDATVSTH